MADPTAILEQFATRGEPRGGPEVLRNAYALVAAERIPAVPTGSGARVRRRRVLVLTGVLTVLIVVAAVWLVNLKPQTTTEVTTAPSRRENGWVRDLPPGAFPKSFQEVARGSELGQHWILAASGPKGAIRELLLADGLTSEVGPNPAQHVNASASTGGYSPGVTYTHGVVPADTSTVRIATVDGAREVAAVGDAGRYGVRFFASVDTAPTASVRTIAALDADGHVIATTVMGS